MKNIPVLLVAMVVVGCGGSSSSSSSSSTGGAGPVMTLGSAEPGMPHQAISDDAEVPMIAGPQGGHHIWLSLGLPLGTVAAAGDVLEAQYRVADGAAVLADGRTFISLHDLDGQQQDSGATMFLVETATLTTLQHQPLDVDVTLRTQSGTTVAAAHRRWRVSCCSGGGFGNSDGHGADGGLSGGSGTVDCAGYCALVTPGCGNGTPAMYSGSAACLADCATFSTSGIDGFGSGNTLQCRVFHAQAAVGNAGACSRLASTLAGFCVDGCGYYCALMERHCPQQRPATGCSTECAGYPNAGHDGDAQGNTLQCRVHFAELAAPDNAAFCANASAAGGTACTP